MAGPSVRSTVSVMPTPPSSRRPPWRPPSRCCGSPCSGTGCPRGRRGSPSSVGSGFSESRSTEAMTMPGVQKPHWRPWHSLNAFCTGCHSPSFARPWIVVTSLPSTWTARTLHAFALRPSMRTVQAPQFEVSHPIGVPTRPRSSRSQWTRRSRGSTSPWRWIPSTVTPIWVITVSSRGVWSVSGSQPDGRRMGPDVTGVCPQMTVLRQTLSRVVDRYAERSADLRAGTRSTFLPAAHDDRFAATEFTFRSPSMTGASCRTPVASNSTARLSSSTGPGSTPGDLDRHDRTPS